MLRLVFGDPLALIAGDYQVRPGELRMVRQQAQMLIAQMPPQGAEITAISTAPGEAVSAERIEVLPPER